jgi:hypothetical protein
LKIELIVILEDFKNPHPIIVKVFMEAVEGMVRE